MTLTAPRPARVSVLLPVRNAASTLAACLDSLAAQTLSDFEVLAIDDGSADDSRQLLEARAARDPRLRVRSREPRGLPATLNEGLSLARAPLIARMDADDVARPERFCAQVEHLDSHPAVGILGTRVELFAAGPLTRGMRAYVAWQNRLCDHAAIERELLVESPLTHPSVMLRRDLLERLGGYRDFEGPEDYDLWLRAHQDGIIFSKLPRRLLELRDSPGRLTRVSSRYSPERFMDLKLEALEAGLLRGSRGVVIWGAGPIGKSWARRLRDRNHEIRAFVEVARRKLGQRIHGAPVLAVSDARIPGALHLAAVGQPGARARIRRAAAALGLRDGVDLIAVA